jgi:Protein kinase domain
MIKKIFLLILVLFAAHGFANEQENSDSSDPHTICSSTECYTVLKVLGEGAFGKVYAVEDSAGHPFAIKAYIHQSDPSFAHHPLADPQREYQRGQLLNHPNIVKAYDLFEDQSDPENHMTYLLLELIKGKPLYEIPKKSLFPKQSLNSALQLIDALRYALSQKLLHLDLHGANVMLADSSETMVIDLASFFSFNELLKGAEEKKEEEEKPDVIPDQPLQAQFASVKANVKPLHVKKLQQFFIQNPKLLEKIKLAAKKGKKGKKAPKYAKENKIPKVNKVDYDPALQPLLTYYFDRITEMCIEFILKSDLSREEKIEMRAAIKSLAWNYSEDLDDELLVPIDDYLYELTKLLRLLS